jgi:small GTP-binding protein
MKSAPEQEDLNETDLIDLSTISETFNIILMGDSSTGKTSILQRFCDNFFKTEKNNINYLQIFKKVYLLLNKSYLIKFWDPPDFMDNCNDFEINMFRNCDGIIYICSYDNAASLTHINTWYQFLTQYVDLSTKEMALFVNKKDLKEENKNITEEQIDKKSKDLQLDVFEISAKSGYNVNKSFKNIIDKIIEKYKNINKSKGYEYNTESSDNEIENEKEEGCSII